MPQWVRTSARRRLGIAAEGGRARDAIVDLLRRFPQGVRPFPFELEYLGEARLLRVTGKQTAYCDAPSLQAAMSEVDGSGRAKIHGWGRPAGTARLRFEEGLTILIPLDLILLTHPKIVPFGVAATFMLSLREAKMASPLTTVPRRSTMASSRGAALTSLPEVLTCPCPSTTPSFGR